jgi:hypothetical protein
MIASHAMIFAELFTSGRLREIAWHGFTETLRSAIAALQDRQILPRDATVRHAMDAAFDILHREYPIEYVFKTCVLRRTVFGTYSPNTTSLYMEFPVSDARADMLLINGDAMVYEIKTRFDDPGRLARQLQEYYRAFTRVNVVVDPEDAARYEDLLPEHVGVLTVTSRFSLSSYRAPTEHTNDLDPEAIFRLLRQAEYRRIVGSLASVDPADEYRVALERFRSFSAVEAHWHLVAALRNRQRTQRLAELCATLPESLHAGAFAFRWRLSDWQQLTGVLDAPVPT